MSELELQMQNRLSDWGLMGEKFDDGKKQENRIPRLTARLKSLSVKPELLENCVLLRDIEASMPTTGVSVLTGTGPCVPMSVLNAYLPEPGEYALEVYAAPPGSDESTEQTAYHLINRFKGALE
ncbi:hypothetical protein ACTXT7_016365 [Hymenolepis weldensis]